MEITHLSRTLTRYEATEIAIRLEGEGHPLGDAIFAALDGEIDPSGLVVVDVPVEDLDAFDQALALTITDNPDAYNAEPGDAPTEPAIVLDPVGDGEEDFMLTGDAAWVRVAGLAVWLRVVHSRDGARGVALEVYDPNPATDGAADEENYLGGCTIWNPETH